MGETFEKTEKTMYFYFSFPFSLFQSSLLLLFFYFMSVGVVCVAIYRKGEGMGKFAVNTMSSFLNISLGYLATSEYSWRTVTKVKVARDQSPLLQEEPSLSKKSNWLHKFHLVDTNLSLTM